MTHTYACANCDWTGDELGCSLADTPNLGERLDPGGVVPAGECPECGCFAYLTVPADMPPAIVRLVDACLAKGWALRFADWSDPRQTFADFGSTREAIFAALMPVGACLMTAREGADHGPWMGWAKLVAKDPENPIPEHVTTGAIGALMTAEIL